MNVNFFQWIRDGVKHSVLQGVSDAVHHLGKPREGDDMDQKLMAFLQDSRPGTPRIAGDSPRKKLGRTLDQIQAGTNKPA